MEKIETMGQLHFLKEMETSDQLHFMEKMETRGRLPIIRWKRCSTIPLDAEVG